MRAGSRIWFFVPVVSLVVGLAGGWFMPWGRAAHAGAADGARQQPDVTRAEMADDAEAAAFAPRTAGQAYDPALAARNGAEQGKSIDEVRDARLAAARREADLWRSAREARMAKHHAQVAERQAGLDGNETLGVP